MLVGVRVDGHVVRVRRRASFICWRMGRYSKIGHHLARLVWFWYVRGIGEREMAMQCGRLWPCDTMSADACSLRRTASEGCLRTRRMMRGRGQGTRAEATVTTTTGGHAVQAAGETRRTPGMEPSEASGPSVPAPSYKWSLSAHIESTVPV
jgi:hypothetical protein